MKYLDEFSDPELASGWTRRDRALTFELFGVYWSRTSPPGEDTRSNFEFSAQPALFFNVRAGCRFSVVNRAGQAGVEYCSGRYSQDDLPPLRKNNERVIA